MQHFVSLISHFLPVSVAIASLNCVMVALVCTTEEEGDLVRPYWFPCARLRSNIFSYSQSHLAFHTFLIPLAPPFLFTASLRHLFLFLHKLPGDCQLLILQSSSDLDHSVQLADWLGIEFRPGFRLGMHAHAVGHHQHAEWEDLFDGIILPLNELLLVR